MPRAEAKAPLLTGGEEVDAWFAGINLGGYGYAEAIKREGYDQVAFFKDVDDAEATRLARDVAHMKVPHQRAFLAALQAMKAPLPGKPRPQNKKAQNQKKPFRLMREKWEKGTSLPFGFCVGDISESLMVKPFPQFNPDDWAGHLDAQQYAEIEASLRTNFPAAQGTTASQRRCVMCGYWMMALTIIGMPFSCPCIFKLTNPELPAVSAR
jgi:hypothetical protein